VSRRRLLALAGLAAAVLLVREIVIILDISGRRDLMVNPQRYGA
jgi:hypothetical protein